MVSLAALPTTPKPALAMTILGVMPWPARSSITSDSDPSTVTSPRCTLALPPAARISAANTSSFSSRRANSATHQPRRANSRASPAPMPDEAPVIKAVCDVDVAFICNAMIPPGYGQKLVQLPILSYSPNHEAKQSACDAHHMALRAQRHGLVVE